jgi:cellulose synthase/poly-beta-1,6-N-acetylglucosamine synthase-like glycosyltransferase
MHNLRRKLRNLVELEYPLGIKEIIVVSDGSTDATNQILAANASESLHVIIVNRHAGKANALNQAIRGTRGEIVVFTDARQIIDSDALTHLVANFADPTVGAVSGELILEEPGSSKSLRGVGLYWKLEKKIRQLESATGSVVGTTGAFYAVRRPLLVTMPAEVILDDVYLPLQVARQGYRVVFAPQAVAREALQGSARQEFRRKVRTLVGNYQLLQLAPWVLTRCNPIRFRLISHKIMRLLVPFALLALFLSAMSVPEPLYQFAAGLQIIIYGSAAWAVLQPRSGLLGALPSASLAFLLLNTAAVYALVKFVTGEKRLWVR